MNTSTPSENKNFIGFLLLSAVFISIMAILCVIGSRADTYKTTDYAWAPITYTVVLDAGHGGEDGGASGSGIYEKNLNLAIAMDVGAYLENSGIHVIYTRTEDILLYDRNVDFKGRKKVLDLAARLKVARECESAVFVSIHMNAFPQKQYKGLQVYYSPNHALSKTIATSIQENTRNFLDHSNLRKIKEAGSSIYLLDRLEKPAVLIECGFLSNDEEAAKLATEEYQQQLALVIAHSLISCLRNSDTH